MTKFEIAISVRIPKKAQFHGWAAMQTPELFREKEHQKTM